MKHLGQVLLAVVWKLGGFGLLALGILDSSFIFAPLGNDLLVVAMSARHHTILEGLYYAFMSSVGSVLGCVLVDVIFRKAGEHGLEKHLSRRRLDYVRGKVTANGAAALAVASLAPPPFPFTPFIMAAAALEYPRHKMLLVVGASRMLRFTGLAVLAYYFGTRILRWGTNPVVQGFIIGLVVVCTVGTVVSIWGWIRRSRRAGAPQAPTAEREAAHERS